MFVDGNPDLDLTLRALILGPLALIWVVVIVRITGLRTFSKMTATDFVATVATASLLANAAGATQWPDFLQAAAAIAAILGVQAGIARLRRNSEKTKDIIENNPTVLMRNGKFIQSAMDRTRVAEPDLWAKLREANVTDVKQVRAVVLETTGDISVLHGPELNETLLTGVKQQDG